MSTEVIDKEDISLPTEDQRHRLSYEDQLYLWCLLLQNNLAGKLSPAVTKGEGARAPVLYDLLVPDTVAVRELNAVSDTPITVKHLPAILKAFRHLEPPYSSTAPKGRFSAKISY